MIPTRMFLSHGFQPGHFSLGPPFGFDETGEFSRAWRGPDFPRFIAVTLQHPCPYFDDSYAVNSANCGPYGDAIHRELIPEIEKRFRCIPEAYARVLTGGSTGGWIPSRFRSGTPTSTAAAGPSPPTRSISAMSRGSTFTRTRTHFTSFTNGTRRRPPTRGCRKRAKSP